MTPFIRRGPGRLVGLSWCFGKCVPPHLSTDILYLLLEELLLMEVTLSRPVIVTRSPGLAGKVCCSGDLSAFFLLYNTIG